jgi:UDP-N-acetylglucosamine--N-acetylmuramyl-(pentapeptide) pyrophosphoryl-undecaprenol N-acetylglucosamine transferase
MSGGGTAGHIYPALAVADRLLADGHDVTFIGTPDGLEARLVPEAGVAFRGVRSRGFDRGNPITLLTSAFIAGVSVVRSIFIVRSLRPDVVLGFGGYVSLPVGLAAVLTRTPLVLHEQNSVPGLANRVLARWADAVCVTYPDSADGLGTPERAVVTGNPVRAAVSDASRDRGRARFGVGDRDVMLLVFGGSRGARRINDAMVSSARALLADPALRVVHVAGRIEAEAVADRVREQLGRDDERYRVIDYIDEMGDAIAASDVVVARAGATSIAELTVVGRPAVLIPYPYATEDHQTRNARAVAEAGAAVVIADETVDGHTLAGAVLGLVSDPGRRERMAAAARTLGRPDAAARVADQARDAVAARKEKR